MFCILEKTCFSMVTVESFYWDLLIEIPKLWCNWRNKLRKKKIKCSSDFFVYYLKHWYELLSAMLNHHPCLVELVLVYVSPKLIPSRLVTYTSQLAFYVNLHRAVIGPSATLTGRWRPDVDLRRMLTGMEELEWI